ncbi:MAG: hypothetical protein FJ206_11885 [Gemmatimonadetes bacterium]|nr:hypothetical protein [Gemmatimonadota bacterium]
MPTSQFPARAFPLAIFAGVLGLVAAAPSVAWAYWGSWHYRITNALYFGPQYVFPFGYTWRPLPEPSPDAHPIGHLASAAVWIGVAGGFGWLARRLSAGRAAWAAVGVILLVTAALHLAVRALGWRFWCDGP